MEGREEQGAVAASKRAAKPFILIESVWELDYRLLEGYRPSPAAVKAFEDGKAILNCWPYFREVVQSSVARMNLPPLTILSPGLTPPLPSGKSAGLARRNPAANTQ